MRNKYGFTALFHGRRTDICACDRGAFAHKDYDKANRAGKLICASKAPRAYSRVLSAGVSCVLAATLAFGMVPSEAWAEGSALAADFSASAAANADTSWYDASKTNFALKSISQLAGLSKLVSQGNDFSGKTVSLANDINAMSATISPIGTKEHPFNGTFDGASHYIDNLTIDSSADSYVGLFGYTGASSIIKDVTLGTSVKISRTVSAEQGNFLSDWGLLVGQSEGSLSNCTVKGNITLASAVVQKSEKETSVIKCIGGIAGVCYGDLTDCTFAGTIDISATSAPVSDYDEAVLVSYVGGVVGYQGDVTKSETTSTPDSHGNIYNCVNEGSGQGDKNNSIKIDTPSMAGKDRFGQEVSAQSSNVGGIAGYARGSVSACTNYGYLNVENACLVGGIVGAWRSVESTANGNYSGEGSDEGSADDPITMSECRNIGIVYARAAVGGIVGQAGTYTTITGCMNGRNKSSRETMVVGTRWNKPFVAGIVGRTYGDVSFCGNLGIVASATWADEKTRTLKGATGYYSAGIAGGILHYTKSDKATGSQVRTSPTPTAYDCYNAGGIETQAGFRARHIVGNNEGYVYDNAALDGACPDAMMTFGEISTDDDASGTASNNLICTDKVDSTTGKTIQTAAQSLKGETSMYYRYRVVKDNKEAFDYGEKTSVFEHLNSTAANNSWQTYWSQSDGSTNSGYPVLNWQTDGYTKTNLSSATLALVSNAKYTGTAAVPNVSATLNGKKLIQNVDFCVVPQEDAIERTPGATPYKATIVGIGKYEGTSTSSVAYGIDKGDLSTCTALIDSKIFNWESQKPDKVVVKNSAGGELSADSFTWELAKDATNAGMYDVNIKANETSDYEGELVGTFVIGKARLMSAVILDGKATISYLGKTYTWYSTTNSTSDDDESKIPVFEYTGYPIEPSVGGIEYLGRSLTLGKDYVVKYGDLGSEGGTSSISVSAKNIGEAGKTCYGAVMVRYAVGSNFANYENMLIKIADTGKKSTLSKDNIVVDSSVPYENRPATPVSVVYAGNTLTEGTDYVITYKNNNGVGTASYTVTGKGRFEGSISGTFEITDAPAYSFTWDIVEVDGKNVAKITGFTYHGSLTGALDIEIPSTVEGDGVTYPVTIIGENAFGGASNSDYEGTYGIYKTRIGTISVPASVTTIENFAFGATSSITSKSALEKVNFAANSQLQTIGEDAFAYCENLRSFSFPAGVTTIGKRAFYGCSKLTLLHFETVSASLPSSIANNVFNYVGSKDKPVRVVGKSNAVSAVRALATNNSNPNTTGTNGGCNFNFYVEVADLSNAVIADIDTQTIVGDDSDPITPDLKVTLGGKTLKAGTDYTVTYTNNTAAGTATATVSGLGGYIGEKSANFTIAHETVKRLSGTTRLDTMANVVKEGFETCDTVIVATSQSFPDALSASALAGAYSAPIILTDADALSKQATNRIKRLNAKKAYVMGGEAALSAQVVADLKTLGLSVERVAGDTRQDTALKSFKQVVASGKTVDTVILARADSPYDSLSISPYSYAQYAAVVLVQDDKLLSEDAVAAIKASGVKRIVMVGGDACVSDGVKTQLSGLEFERWYGQTRYETSIDIAQHELEQGMQLSCVGVATGTNFPDALAGGALIGSKRGILLLTDGADMSFADKILAPNKDSVNVCYLLGGTSAVSEGVETYLKGLFK